MLVQNILVQTKETHNPIDQYSRLREFPLSLPLAIMDDNSMVSYITL